MKTQETPSSQKTHGPITNESLGAGEVTTLEPKYGTVKHSGRYKWVSTDEDVHHKKLIDMTRTMDSGDQAAVAMGLRTDALMNEITRRLNESDTRISAIMGAMGIVQ